MKDIKYNGQVIAHYGDKPVRKVPVRNANGRFTRAKFLGFIEKSTAVIMVLLCFTAWGPMIWGQNEVVYASSSSEVDYTPAKIEELKMDVVDRLASQCESKGAKDPDGLIVFDSNKVASLGRLQFQVKTVIEYYKQLYGKKIDGAEAIAIATNKEKAYALAKDIIFKSDGLGNWYNCGIKLQLASEIAVLKKLSK